MSDTETGSNTKPAKKKGLNEALRALKDGIGDLSSLEVNTYVGTLSADITAKKGASLIDFETVVKKATTASGTVTLAASTVIKFDGDSNQFFTSESIPQHVIEAHDVALKAGREVRQGLVSLFSSALGVSLPSK